MGGFEKGSLGANLPADSRKIFTFSKSCDQITFQSSSPVRLALGFFSVG
jgi:hypothetical protein